MRVMAQSRNFNIIIDGNETNAFVPFADMLNHKRPKETTWAYDNTKQGFVITACEDIKRGDPVYDSYGKKCNSRFFLEYGFINQPNDADEFPIKIGLNPSDPSYPIK